MVQANFIHVIAYLLDANYSILLNNEAAYILNHLGDKVIYLTTQQFQLIENNFTFTMIESDEGTIYKLDQGSLNPMNKLLPDNLNDNSDTFL